MDLWAYAILPVEKSSDGSIVPFIPLVNCFKPNFFETTLDLTFMIFDVLKVISFLILYTYQFIKNIVSYWKYRKDLVPKIAQNILYFILFVITIVYWVYHFHTVSNTKDLLKNAENTNLDEYIDLYDVMRSNYISIQIEGFMILFQAFFLWRFLRVIPVFNFYFKVLRFVTRVTVIILVFQIVVIFWFSVLSVHIWGTLIKGYSTIYSAFIYTMLMFELRLDDLQLQTYDNFRPPTEEIWENITIYLLFWCIIGLYITTAIVIGAFNIKHNFLEAAEKQRIKKKDHHPVFLWFVNFLVFKRFKNWVIKRRSRRKRYQIEINGEGDHEHEHEENNKETLAALVKRK